MSPSPGADGPPPFPPRATWIADVRREAERRYDARWAPIYDDDWGGRIEPTHAREMAAFLAALPAGARVLDAACGTGKYWPMIRAAGHRVEGVDQSAGMLRVAAAKDPTVPVRRVGLQELAGEPGIAGAFDAVVCMDALENVAPEDWPAVAANLRLALRPGGAAYVTVELPDEAAVAAAQADALALGAPVVDGEDWAPDGGYHYYPARSRVDAWLHEAGFTIERDIDGDDYRHLVLRASS